MEPLRCAGDGPISRSGLSRWGAGLSRLGWVEQVRPAIRIIQRIGPVVSS